ncbi:MAG: hypothetical protein ACI4DN_02755, partial [Lachnospiraceae bacterium]
RNYLAEFFVLWIKAGILYALISSISDREFGLLISAMLFGFTFFNKVLPFNLFGNHDIVIVFWIIKILLSVVIGFIAFPMVNAYYLFNIIVSISRKIKIRYSVGEDSVVRKE